MRQVHARRPYGQRDGDAAQRLTRIFYYWCLLTALRIHELFTPHEKLPSGRLGTGREDAHPIAGGEWHDSGYGTACCPAHDDQTPSLSISIGNERPIVLHCHAGCSQEAVIGALRKRGLWPNKRPEHYDYVDANGQLRFQVVRQPGKKFLQRQPDGRGGWIWNAKGALPLIYRLPEVREAITSSRPVFVTEGEKDADRLAGLGLTATCNPSGAGKWRPEHSAHLHGGHVVILPDNDDPGRKHAQQVAMSLQGRAKSVRVVDLPGLPEKGDVSDWLEADGTVDELERLAASTSEWSPPAETDHAPHRIPLLPFRELAPETRRRELIKGVFPLEGLSVTWGPPKCGTAASRVPGRADTQV